MKKALAVVLLFVSVISFTGFTSCELEKYGPKYNPEEIWVCEKPFIWFSWNDEIDFYDGKSHINGKSTDILLYIGGDCDIEVMTDEVLTTTAETREDADVTLFLGEASFREGKFTYEIEEDFKNIFNGELPTLTFRRYNKEEYIREHGPLE